MELEEFLTDVITVGVQKKPIMEDEDACTYCLTDNSAISSNPFKDYIALYRVRMRFSVHDPDNLKLSVRTALSIV